MKLAQEAIRTLDMKNREKGCNDMVQKTKGLVQRWIVFAKREGYKSDDDAKSKNGVLIKRNVIFSMRCTIGKGRDKKEITAMYRVLTLHKKYYNKWNMITQRDKSAEEVYWKPNYDKGKVRVDAVQISKCKSTDEYIDVDPMTVPKDQRKHIVRVVDICDFIDVYGTATLMSI